MKKLIDSSWMNQVDFDGLEQHYGLPSGTLKAVAHTESAYDPTAYNKQSGATGAFQFMPATAAAFGIDPHDPVASAGAAAKYLGGLYKKYGGDIDKTLAGYNWGPGNVDRKGLSKMPTETQNYLVQVKKKISHPVPA